MKSFKEPKSEKSTQRQIVFACFFPINRKSAIDMRFDYCIPLVSSPSAITLLACDIVVSLINKPSLIKSPLPNVEL